MSVGDEFSKLVDTMRRLRSQCPWDRSQSHDTLRVYLLEEAYEVLHALDGQRYEDLREELGDLMLQIVFHAEIAEEAGRFGMEDVLREINEKLVRRHPHVFGDKHAETPADVVRRWESIKTGEEEKGSSLDGVPSVLPALVRASRVLTKVRQTGVDPFQGRNVLGEAQRWLGRLAAATAKSDQEEAAKAAGMLALAATEIADRVRVNTEDAVRQTLSRLSEAFRAEERRLRAEGRSLPELSASELGAIATRILQACEEG